MGNLVENREMLGFWRSHSPIQEYPKAFIREDGFKVIETSPEEQIILFEDNM